MNRYFTIREAFITCYIEECMLWSDDPIAIMIGDALNRSRK